MRHTDAADDLGLSDEFLRDRCVARDEDEYDSWHREPSCGGRRGSEHGGPPACDGCRKCYPPDFDAKPTGFGIESFEDPALAYANAKVHDMIARVHGAYALLPVERTHTGRVYASTSGLFTMFHAERDRLRRAVSTHSKLRAWASDRVWYRLCDECQTHPEAVAAYKAWVAKALRVRFKDEPRS